MQLFVFTLKKPMTAEKKAQGLVGDEYEKARMCLQGQNHEGFQVQNSTTNADAHLLRRSQAVQANPKHVLASFDVSNAFLNAELSEDVLILTQPELIQFGLVKGWQALSTSARKHAMDRGKHPSYGKKPEIRP